MTISSSNPKIKFNQEIILIKSHNIVLHAFADYMYVVGSLLLGCLFVFCFFWGGLFGVWLFLVVFCGLFKGGCCFLLLMIFISLFVC